MFKFIYMIIIHADRDMQGSGFCRLLNTSSMNCWNGTAVVEQDIVEFDDDDITDQGI